MDLDGSWASQVALVVKNLPANAGDIGDIRDAGSIPELERYPGGGRTNLLQHSCLENPMDRGGNSRQHSIASQKIWT